MSNRPTTSIVIPTLNEEANIVSAIGHAAKLNPCQIIVSDGGSSDATRFLAAKHGAEVIEGPPSRGGQLNAGAQLAVGDVLLFLHADTWLAPQAADQIAATLEDPVKVWGAFRQKIDSPGKLYRALEWGNACRVRKFQLPYGDQAMFVRRDAFDQVGGFANQPLMEDAELSCRLRRLSRPVLLDGPLHTSARRWHRYGVVRQTAWNWGFLFLWRLGICPGKLAMHYHPHNPTEKPVAESVSLRARELSDSA